MPNKVRCLVASGDDEFRAELIERALELDVSVHVICSADELPDYLRAYDFNLLFLDVALGTEQCARVIDALRGSRRPRAILVAAGNPEDLDAVQRKAGRSGIDVIGTLAKPLSSSALSTVLAALGTSEGDASEADLAVRLGAIPANEIVIHYQPIVSMPDRTVRAVEGLVRWQQPQYGLIRPERFISHAERSGAIVPMTWEVLRRALDQHKQWRDEGTLLSVAVNVSTLVLTSLQTADEILDLLRARNCDPRCLTLEITETEEAPDPSVAHAVLSKLRQAGVAIAMDDYGAGYSTIDRLEYYPFTALKLDRGLVARLAGNQDAALEARRTVAMLVAFARREKMSVTGEGIETEGQWDSLAELGCDFGQGFLIARPMRAAQIIRWIERAPRTGDHRPAGSGSNPA